MKSSKTDRTPRPEETAGCREGSVKTRPNPLPAEVKDSNLMKYFREITSHPLLDTAEEQRLARRIVDLELREWQICLEHPPIAAAVAPLVAHALPDVKGSLRFVGRAVKRFRENRGRLSAAQQRRYEDAVARFAPLVKEHDLDRVLLDAVEGWILSGEYTPPDMGPNGKGHGGNGHNGNGHNGKGHNGKGRGARRAAQKVTPPPLRCTKGLARVRGRLREVARKSRRERDRFIAANLRLVISIAKRYNRGTLSLSDLIQEGNIGLMKAVQRYDPERGYRFSTYASWWIRHAINRALADKSRTVRLPVHLIDSHNRLQKARGQFFQREGRDPSDRELAMEMGINMKKLRKIQRQSTDPSFSLDRSISDDNSYRFIDFVCDEESRTPLEQVAYQDWCSEIENILSQLPAIEAQIVRWRYGVRNEQSLTLKEIGERYNLSRERIRQLQQQALHRIRQNVKGLY